MTTRADLHARIAALIDHLADGGQAPEERDRLLEAALEHQANQVPAYARLVSAHRRRGPTLRGVDAFPGLPTDVFRFVRIAAHDPAEDVRTFLTSGTTHEARGLHALRDLSLYDRAARAAAAYALFPGAPAMDLVVLAPSEAEHPESSLSYMLARFTEWFGRQTSCVIDDDRLDLPQLRARLVDAIARGTPIALLGTSFAFVHAHDDLGGERFALPAGSRIMQTGGFKGRSRTLSPDAMRAMLCSDYGVPDPLIVTEYGMTELSSQLYELTLRRRLLHGDPAPARALWVPGWVRASVVDPDTLAPVPDGSTGLLRLDDLANLDGVCAIQTSDLARARATEAGIVVLGRATDATPRGCSLALDEALSGAKA